MNLPARGWRARRGQITRTASWPLASVRPTSSVSVRPRVEDASYRDVTFDELRDGYAEAARRAERGGVDILLIETIFDTLNAKAAIAAVKRSRRRSPDHLHDRRRPQRPQTFRARRSRAFWTSSTRSLRRRHQLLTRRDEMRPYLEVFSRVAPLYVTCYPNAGLPNAFGRLRRERRQPAAASRVAQAATSTPRRLCGTGPEHIRQISEALAGLPPRGAVREPRPRFSGSSRSRSARLGSLW